VIPIKRIDITYDGASYSIGDRDPDELKIEIDEAVASGRPYWLRVNQGGGIPRATDLLITASTHIALTPIHEPVDDSDPGTEPLDDDPQPE
jgi:hypothetical protein